MCDDMIHRQPSGAAGGALAELERLLALSLYPALARAFFLADYLLTNHNYTVFVGRTHGFYIIHIYYMRGTTHYKARLSAHKQQTKSNFQLSIFLYRVLAIFQ